MKVKSVHQESSKITILYLVGLIDNLGRRVDVEFRFNKKDRKYRPAHLWVDGINRGPKLRDFLDENNYIRMSTESFMERLALKVKRVTHRRRQAETISKVMSRRKTMV